MSDPQGPARADQRPIVTRSLPFRQWPRSEQLWALALGYVRKVEEREGVDEEG